MGFDEAAGDREAEAGAALGSRRVAAPEAIEHAALGFFAEPVAGVLDAHSHRVDIGLDADSDCAVRWGVPQRVRQEVQQPRSTLSGANRAIAAGSTSELSVM